MSGPVAEDEYAGCSVGEITLEEIELPNILRVAAAGNADAGKSTCVANLTRRLVDDGRGKTCSVGEEVMGFDEKGKQVLPELSEGRMMKFSRTKLMKFVKKHATKSVRFADLAGQETYFRDFAKGLMRSFPHCLLATCLIVTLRVIQLSYQENDKILSLVVGC